MAGALAGIRITGQTVVVQSAIRLYSLMAVASFAAALLWHVITPPMSRSDAVGIHLFRHVIGELDGRSCGSYPVCSSYAAEAIKRYGFIYGSWFAMDRIIHEVGDMRESNWIIIDGKRRLYDPLSRNDFWLDGE